MKKFNEFKVKNVKMIEVQDWDGLVESTYGRPYSFQQQDGCKSRGTFKLTIPEEVDEDFGHDDIPEKINGNVMGVKFSKWLERDPKQPVGNEDSSWISLFWERNFYPDVQMVANDLYERGLIEAGDYIINIDW